MSSRGLDFRCFDYGRKHDAEPGHGRKSGGDGPRRRVLRDISFRPYTYKSALANTNNCVTGYVHSSHGEHEQAPVHDRDGQDPDE